MEDPKVDNEHNDTRNKAYKDISAFSALLLFVGLVILMISLGSAMCTTTDIGIARCFLGFLTGGCLVATALVFALGYDYLKVIEETRQQL